MANHSIPPKMDTASGLDDFISFTTQFQTRSEIHSFLRMALFNHESDVVISILRKGYWIIEDFIRTEYIENNIVCLSEKEITFNKIKNKNIIIFDDSIHTGNGSIDIIKKLKVLDATSIKLVCLIINDEAIKIIHQKYPETEIIALKQFSKYEDCNGDNELLPGCQTYYYIHYVVPYVSSLSINYSPHFYNWRLKIDSCSNDQVDYILENLIKCMSSDIMPEKPVWNPFIRIWRASVNINWRNEIPVRWINRCSDDFSKIRIAVSIYNNYTELVITPMICPIILSNDFLNDCETFSNDEYENILRDFGEYYVKNHKKEILLELKKLNISLIEEDVVQIANDEDDKNSEDI